MVEGNHVVYRISAPSPEEKEEWMKSIRCAGSPVRALSARGCTHVHVGARLRVWPYRHVCAAGGYTCVPPCPGVHICACICGSGCTHMCMPARMHTHIGVLDPRCWQRRGGLRPLCLEGPQYPGLSVPPTSRFPRRASISRDPFYDMLATRKRRIANKK